MITHPLPRHPVRQGPVIPKPETQKATSVYKHLIASALATLALGGAVAGCGDDDATTSNASAPSTPAATTPKPSADAAAVDKAFVRQMIPHHQMAVDMAELAEKRGEHEEVKQLATDIISAQSKEIAELEAIAKELDVTPAKPMGDSGSMEHGDMAADAKALGLSMNEMGMSMNMGSLERAEPFDKAFIAEMTPHHEGAIAMANAQLAGGKNADLKKIATAIIAAQEKEISEMAAWNADWYGAGSSAGSSDQAGGMSGDMGDMSEAHSGH